MSDLKNSGKDVIFVTSGAQGVGAAKAGLHPFAAGKYMEQTRYFKMEELRAVLEESAELEERVKTGRLTDTLAVELFLVKYSS